MVYSFTMKYVAIIAAVIFILRIDFILGLFDRAKEKVSSSTTKEETINLSPSENLISVTDDKALKLTNKMKTIGLLQEFHSNPTEVVRSNIIATLKTSRDLLGEKLDKDLEASLYVNRDLLPQKNPQFLALLIDLMKILKGDNHLVVKKFFSLYADLDLKSFFSLYPFQLDSNCQVMGLIGDNLDVEEKVNLLMERSEQLASLLQKNPPDKNVAEYGKICEIVLSLELKKYEPTAAPVSEDSTVAPSAPSILPAPVPQEDSSQ